MVAADVRKDVPGITFVPALAAPAAPGKRKAEGGAAEKTAKKQKREFVGATSGDFEKIQQGLQALLVKVGDLKSVVHRVENARDVENMLYAEIRNKGERICLNQRLKKKTHDSNNSALFLKLRADYNYDVMYKCYSPGCDCKQRVIGRIHQQQDGSWAAQNTM